MKKGDRYVVVCKECDSVNKDALLFSIAISGPDGESAMELIHRPLFSGTGPDEKLHCRFPRI